MRRPSAGKNLMSHVYLALSLLFIISSCSNTLVAKYDEDYQYYRLSKNSKSAILRDSNKKIIRDKNRVKISNDTISLDNVLLSTSSLGLKHVDSLEVNPTALKFYFDGIVFSKKNMQDSAIYNLTESIKTDSNLFYNSDVLLWIASSYQKKGDSSKAVVFFEQFQEFSSGLKPPRIQSLMNDIHTYPSALKSLNNFDSLASKPNFFSYNLTHTPLKIKGLPGEYRPAQLDMRMFYTNVSKFGISPSLSAPASLISPKLDNFKLSIGGNINYEGGYSFTGIDYSILRSYHNEFGLTFGLHGFYRRINGETSGYNILIPLEFHKFLGYDSYIYSSYNYYLDNQLHLKSDNLKQNFYKIGVAHYLTGALGLTARMVNTSFQSGLILERFFIGYDFNKNEILISFDDLGKYFKL
jgi:hypothetical protein